MAEYVEKIEPTEAVHVIKLSQSEMDLLGGIINDLTDNRGVVMDYTKDNSRVILNAKGYHKMEDIRSAFERVAQDIDFDYFDWWKEVDTPSE